MPVSQKWALITISSNHTSYAKIISFIQMKKTFIATVAIILSAQAFSQSTYTFSGNGNWTADTNWINDIVPPDTLPAGSVIYISPANLDDSCVLDRTQVILNGAELYVSTDSKLIIHENINRLEYPFPTVTICNKVWMLKNLDVVTFRNGDTIRRAPTTLNDLSYMYDPLWSHYNNDPANDPVYGKLYNFYAVSDPRGLAPVGWHIPTIEEWNQLIDSCLGGSLEAGKAMKEAGFAHWENPNMSDRIATNSSGLTCLPGGIRYIPGTFVSPPGRSGNWWSSSTSTFDGNPFRISLNYLENSVLISSLDGRGGISVRCVKD